MPTVTDQENGTGFAKGKLTRVVQHGWKIVDHEGQFLRLSKHLLKVDPRYQRDNVSSIRVNRMASEWSWIACGTLGVAEREDNSYWVFDGQTRKLAADKRVDIQELPCLVYKVESLTQEATGFLSINTLRGPVSMIHRFKAMVTAGDVDAIAVKTLIDKFGYRVNANVAQFSIKCVGIVLNSYRKDPEITDRVFGLCAEIACGNQINEQIFHGLWFLEWKASKNTNFSPIAPHNKEVLMRSGNDMIAERIRKARGYYGKGGEKVCAQGIVDLLNARRKSRRLPNLFSTDSSGGDTDE